MNCNAVVFIVAVIFIINFNNSYQCPDADEVDPNIEFFNYDPDALRERTVVEYFDSSTDAPRKTIYIRRKPKKKRKRKPKKSKRILRARFKQPEPEKDEQNIQAVPYEVHTQIKKKRTVTNIKGRQNKTNGIKRKKKRTRKNIDRDEPRKPVDIIIHIKMKE